MEISDNQRLITAFLDKNYTIKEQLLFSIYDDVHEWGVDIVKGLSKIFSFDEDYCKIQLYNWVDKKYLMNEKWSFAYAPHKLKTKWSPEMAQDLRMLHGIENAEEELIALMSEQIAKEIDAEILKTLRGQINSNEFINVMKCVGYETTETIYDPHTMKPTKGFISMKFNDVENERNINPHWQDWIRTRK